MSALDIRFVAPLPPVPMRKGADVRRGRRGVHAHLFTEKKSETWQAHFAAIASRFAPARLFDGPVRLDILAVLARPKKLKGDIGLNWMPVRPDADNLRKNVQDAMRAWWADDKQIVAGETLKVYAEKDCLPRTIIRVQEIGAVDVRSIADAVFGAELIDSRDFGRAA